MRMLDRVTIASLLLIGMGICMANVWYAAARSTIPLALNGTVTQKKIGTEKHPGQDDAYMIAVDDGPLLCIDKLPYEALNFGDNVTKRGWQRSLNVSGHIVSLVWSRDFYGLLWCMLAAVVIMSLMVALTPSPNSLTP